MRRIEHPDAAESNTRRLASASAVERHGVDTLDDFLDRLDALDDDGDDEGLHEELARARRAFPEALELREWEAFLAGEDGRFDEALAILDRVLAVEPGRLWVRRERATALLELGRFADALAVLQALTPEERGELDPAERASVHRDLAVCLDRLGRTADADVEYRAAARLDPRTFPVPLRLEPARFEALVARALDGIPPELRELLAQVVVRVEPWPGPEAEDPLQLGLYVGVARTDRTVATTDHLDHIVIYQRSHELACRDEAGLRAEVRRTVIHEIAHHFGIPHERMDEYE
jgi:predicted Zn-dependent protease with MMP-like domain